MSSKRTRRKAPAKTGRSRSSRATASRKAAPDERGTGAEREPEQPSIAQGADDEPELVASEAVDDPSESTAVLATAEAPKSTSALSVRDPLQAYLRDVQRYPLLTSEEEKTLTRRYAETGDPEIARRLVTANLRLVVKLAFEYRRAYKNMMDLVQEGNIGLMQAVKRYDPYRGVKLSSYSAWWIRAYMLRFILNNWRLVKLGTTQAQRKLFFNLNKQKARLSAMGIEPSAKLIADRLGVKESEVVDMDRRMSNAEKSLDVPWGSDDGSKVARVEMMASVQAPADETVASHQLGEMLSEHLERFRADLAGKELTIFDKRLVAEDPMTLQKLGELFGVSRERVRQIEARLVGRLRNYLTHELGDAVQLGT